MDVFKDTSKDKGRNGYKEWKNDEKKEVLRFLVEVQQLFQVSVKSS